MAIDFEARDLAERLLRTSGEVIFASTRYVEDNSGEKRPGYVYNLSTHALVSSSVRDTVIIPVAAGDEFLITSSVLGATFALMVVFDSAGNELAVIGQGTAGYEETPDRAVTIPTALTNAAYAYVHSRNDRGVFFSVKRKLTAEEYVSLNQPRVTGYWNKTTGIDTSAGSNNYRNFPEVPVTAGDIIRFSGIAAGDAMAIGVVVNKSGAVIDTFGEAEAAGATRTWGTTTYRVPAGAAGLRVTGYIVNPSIRKMALGGSSAAVTRLAASSDRANGLIVHGIGTSIPAMSYQNGTTYWALAAADLGCTINNYAVGTSSIRCGLNTAASGAVVVGSITSGVLTVTKVLYGTVTGGAALSPAFVAAGVTIDSQTGGTTGGVGTYSLTGSPADVAAGTTIFIGSDPLGWSGKNWDLVTRSLAQTVGEKEELIRNLAKWGAGGTAALTNAPATLNTAAADLIRSYSYEQRVLPHLATSDALLISHGYNDSSWAAHDGSVSTIPSDSRDRCTFIGAFNWLMDRVLESRDVSALPPIPVVMEGHYSRSHKPNIVEAQEYLAKKWGFVLIPTWERTGWSDQTITTTGYWDSSSNGIWIPSGGAPQTITLIQRAFADALHTHSDKSGDATRDMKGAITPGLRDALFK